MHVCLCTHKQKNTFFSITVAPKTWKTVVQMIQRLSKNKSHWSHTSVLYLKYLVLFIVYNSNYWVIKLIFFFCSDFFFYIYCFISAIGKLWTSCRCEVKFQCASVGCLGETPFIRGAHISPPLAPAGLMWVYHRNKKNCVKGIIPCCIFRTFKPDSYLGTNSQARK